MNGNLMGGKMTAGPALKTLCKWEDSIIMAVGRYGVGWINLVQDGAK